MDSDSAGIKATAEIALISSALRVVHVPKEKDLILPSIKQTVRCELARIHNKAAYISLTDEFLYGTRLAGEMLP